MAHFQPDGDHAFPDTLIAAVTATGLNGRAPGPVPPRLWRTWRPNSPTAPGPPPTRATRASRRGTPPTAPSAPIPAVSGEPDTTENPKPSEIIYTDTTDVLTGHWNHRDAHRTRVTEDSTHVAFVLETLTATRDGHLLTTAADELQDLLTEHSAQSAVHYLSPAHPQVTL
ncbi:hypothetical protein SUDANB151_06781 [Streptomyces sp. enrichment culture]